MIPACASGKCGKQTPLAQHTYEVVVLQAHSARPPSDWRLIQSVAGHIYFFNLRNGDVYMKAPPALATMPSHEVRISTSGWVKVWLCAALQMIHPNTPAVKPWPY